jgi:geranylgeranyl reductase family protein
MLVCQMLNHSNAVCTYDVAVIGAGPAGAIAARDLARSGARVAIVDGSHPREKSCGGGVTSRAMKFLEDDVRLEGCAISAAIFEVDGSRAEVTIASDDALTVFPRAVFDAALLAQAVTAGADHFAMRARAVDRWEGCWIVACPSGPLKARWLLGADGPSGIVRRHVFRPFDRHQLSIAAGSFVDGVASSEVVVRFIDDPSGYLWSFPRPDHLAVGACAQASETSTAVLYEITDRWLTSYALAKDRPRQRYAWPIPSLSPRDLDRERPSGPNWMLLGDAAGLVDPITREGIFFAMRSGQLAAAALGTHEPARAYQTSIRGEIHSELRRAAELKAAFFRPRFTRLLIEALNHSSAIRAVMIDLIAGRQDYASLKRRLLGTLEFGLMMKLVGSERKHRRRPPPTADRQPQTHGYFAR